MKRRWRWPLGCVSVLILILAYRVLSVYQFRPGFCEATAAAPAIAATYPRRLLVMTYNIEGHAELIRGDHIARVADVINEIQPDVVGLNEVHRRTWQSRFSDTVDELRRRTRMNAVFGESYQQLGGQFGNAILTRGRIVSHDVYKLPGIGEPRSLLEATIDIGGGQIEFYVTHLAAWEQLNRGIRGDQLECLAHHVRASAHPFVLTGDINAPPESPEVASFLKKPFLQICGKDIEPTQKIMKSRIDYIFADRGWRILQARTLDTGPSDHRPVIAELVHDATSQQ